MLPAHLCIDNFFSIFHVSLHLSLSLHIYRDKTKQKNEIGDSRGNGPNVSKQKKIDWRNRKKIWAIVIIFMGLYHHHHQMHIDGIFGCMYAHRHTHTHILSTLRHKKNKTNVISSISSSKSNKE